MDVELVWNSLVWLSLSPPPVLLVGAGGVQAAFGVSMLLLGRALPGVWVGGSVAGVPALL